MNPLPIPQWKWEDIAMDFVLGLPRTQFGHDSIWVIINHLTKSTHFLPIKKTFFFKEKLAKLYMKDIVRLHGTPTTIVSNRNPRFTSRFWPSLQTTLGTKLKFNTAFHP